MKKTEWLSGTGQAQLQLSRTEISGPSHMDIELSKKYRNVWTKGIYITKGFKGLLALPAWARVNNLFKHLRLLKVKWSLLKNRQFKFVYSFVYFLSWFEVKLSTNVKNKIKLPQTKLSLEDIQIK